MKRLIQAIRGIIRGLSTAISRFPLTVICLLGAAVLICYMISLHKEPDLIIQKLMFTFLLGAFLGITAQFTYERFTRLARLRLLVYLVSAVLTAGYYLILLPAPSISFEVLIRTLVAVFAMLCALLWVPSFRGRADFNIIALTHFKSIAISIVYSGVLAAGLAAIIAAINVLLFKINSDAYGYMMTMVWVIFAPIYYLSLLPYFNSDVENDREQIRRATEYFRALEILISYIAIPLLFAYTLVLAAYFVKILVTMKWPSGQLGVMVLAYSAAGLIIYVLASQLKNRFASWYRLVFPKVLIPVVIMQLVSVAIRLNAYGVTESRYYVALFGIFSLVSGIVLSFVPVSKNGIIALLAAGFAIFSVIPPVDAFTVSRVSQISRLENLLGSEGLLVDGKLKPRADVSDKLRRESTSILSYLESRKYTKDVKWLPSNFNPYNDIKSTLGFEPAYNNGPVKNFYASLDMQKPINISGYDMYFNTYLNQGTGANQPVYDFEVRGSKYRLEFNRISAQEVRILVKNAAGKELVGTGIYDFVKSISAVGVAGKTGLPPEKMTLSVENNGYKLRIMFQNINVTYGGEMTSDYGLYVMFGAP
ncbi:MAG: DUF4153 domain-containing protein, partial [Methylocystaceae bacterium]